MAKYHVNDKGNTGVCEAKWGCPFGDASEHFDTEDGARKNYEKMNTLNLKLDRSGALNVSNLSQLKKKSPRTRKEYWRRVDEAVNNAAKKDGYSSLQEVKDLYQAASLFSGVNSKTGGRNPSIEAIKAELKPILDENNVVVE